MPNNITLNCNVTGLNSKNQQCLRNSIYKYAVDDVYIICSGHNLFDNIKVSYANYEKEIYEKLKKIFDDDSSALNVVVCILQKGKEQNTWIRFEKLINRIATNADDKHHTLRFAFDTVQTILKVKYAQELLEFFGYTKNNESLIFNPDETGNSVEKAKEFLKIKNQLGDAVCSWQYDPNFDLLENAYPLEECMLPSIFFTTVSEIRTPSIALPIKILKDRCRDYSFSKFSLVRVKFQGGCYCQRVFLKTSSLNSVKIALNSFIYEGELCEEIPPYKMFNDKGEEITDMSKTIAETFPFYSAVLITLN
uniref:Uncharacterized protein n=1 Tax=Panagrolaimus superbus TaxID=310955 RepID=A0A914ZAC5_9BILA